ncbi:methyl-accepting chemotaxis protein [Vibrio sp. TBV020]|uniref:methyl-accepting chemotaxis protein n=1 Tax=Vibrio sp. TBV020 TaxID=3137398 RepID=UPI0038CDADD9
MALSNVPLKYKIALGAGIPLLLLIFLSIVSIASSRSQVETSAMVDHTHKVIQQAMKIEAAAVDMETGMRGYLLAGKTEFLQPYENGQREFTRLVTSLKVTVDDNPTQVTRLGEIETTINEWLSNVTEPAIELRGKVGDTTTMDDISELVAEARGKTYFDKFRSQIADFIAMEDELMIKRQAAAEGAAASMENTLIFGTVLAIALGSVISWSVIKAITEPVREVARGLELLADGDLTATISVKSKDEIGMMANSYNQAVKKTNDVIMRVHNTTDEVVDGALSITKANDEMKKELEYQSDKVAQISASIEEMSVSIQEVASKSSDATSSAQSAGVTANSGGQIVSDTIEGMKSINDAVSASSNSVAELGKRGAEIGEIISVINGIAEQTNLLALNAAIEAARAGEAGRGFAVVADEVRALADRTTTATREIGGSIETIQGETQRAVERMESGSNYVQEGLKLARQAGDSLENIVSGSHEVASMIDSIAAATEQQSLASSEVARNVEGVSQASQNANVQANTAARSARSLAEKAEQLRKIVNQFKVA